MNYYDRAGQRISLGEWADLIASSLYKRVAYTEWLTHDVRVSTVWLGMDHRFGDEGAPLIFETMVFGGHEHDTLYRWTSEDEAHAGHEMIVALVSMTIGSAS